MCPKLRASDFLIRKVRCESSRVIPKTDKRIQLCKSDRFIYNTNPIMVGEIIKQFYTIPKGKI